MTALKEGDDESELGPMSWKKKKMQVLGLLLANLIVIAILVDFAVLLVNNNPFLDKPARYSVELVAATGISSSLTAATGISSSLAAGAAPPPPPAFELLVHVDNGHVFGLCDGGSDVVVSYADVPLARGRAPAFHVEAKEAVAVAVNATSGGAVGIPDGLFQLMAEERRSGATPRLQVDVWLDAGLFRCSVELDGERRASPCDEVNFIYIPRS